MSAVVCKTTLKTSTIPTTIIKKSLTFHVAANEIAVFFASQISVKKKFSLVPTLKRFSSIIYATDTIMRREHV